MEESGALMVIGIIPNWGVSRTSESSGRLGMTEGGELSFPWVTKTLFPFDDLICFFRLAFSHVGGGL